MKGLTMTEEKIARDLDEDSFTCPACGAVNPVYIDEFIISDKERDRDVRELMTCIACNHLLSVTAHVAFGVKSVEAVKNE